MAEKLESSSKPQEQVPSLLEDLDFSKLSMKFLRQITDKDLKVLGRERLEELHNSLVSIKNKFEINKQRLAKENNQTSKKSIRFFLKDGQFSTELKTLQENIDFINELISKVSFFINNQEASIKKEINPENLVKTFSSFSGNLAELDDEVAKRVCEILKENLNKTETQIKFLRDSEYEKTYRKLIEELNKRLSLEDTKVLDKSVEININQPDLINLADLSDSEKQDLLKSLRMRVNSNFLISDEMSATNRALVAKRIRELGKDPEDYTWNKDHRKLKIQLEEYFSKKNGNKDKYDGYVPLKDRRNNF